MARQNETFKVCKTYKNGHQYVNKLVGRSALMEYETKIFDSLGDKVVSLTITNCGRKEKDIENKEEINRRSMEAIERHDVVKSGTKKSKKDEVKDEERDDMEKLADALGIDKESVEQAKNLFDKIGGDDGDNSSEEEVVEESYDEENWKDRGFVVPEDEEP